MNKIFLTPLMGLAAIFIASFGDEVASVTFAFAQVDVQSMGGVSLLLSSALIGGLASGPIATYLLNRFHAQKILLFVFIFAGIVVLLSASYPKDVGMYLASFILGCLGNLFWSVLSVIIPQRFEESSLMDVNKVVHSVRNSGYILGPILAGLLNAKYGVHTALIIVGTIFLFAAPFTRLVLSKKNEGKETFPQGHSIAPWTFPEVWEFFRLRGMKTTLLPLVITICTTSTFNVAFIHLFLVDLQYNEAAYGILASAVSFGLVLGPLWLTHFAQKNGLGFGACVCATIIGLCLVSIGIYQKPAWLFCVLLLLGLANGVQNTLMATFVMKAVPEEKRKVWMPMYLFIVQAAVLAGFMIGGQVPVEHARLLLIVAGGVASIAGLVGAIGNHFKESLPWNPSSAKIQGDI